ncbi:MAG: ABC transporter [Verrucomicrobiota bacterium]|nr:MAG: ABC transporter [Verrucomicrobiota bacterium]
MKITQSSGKLKVENLSKKFDTPNGEILALNKINFQIFHGIHSVIGPSGCGKTTLIRILAGLDFPSSGNVFLEGKKMEGPGAERGMVFQDYTLFPWLSVKKNVMFGLEIKGLGKLKAEAEAMEWLDIVGLAKFADAYPEQLSGGMKQRVAIARSLANRPEILFLDEPFGALDAQTRSSMQAYLLKIWQNVDVTVFFVTHDLDEAIYLSDRILVLRANPGEIDELIEVPVPRPRAPGQFLTPEFLATKKRLEEIIRPPELAQNDEFPMVRLTDVGDEVE